jgi:hypothetical protein
MPNATDDRQDAPHGLSRRNLLKRAGGVGAVAATPGTTLARTATAVTARAQTPARFTAGPRSVVVFQEARQSYRCHQAVYLSLQPDESCGVERT